MSVVMPPVRSAMTLSVSGSPDRMAAVAHRQAARCEIRRQPGHVERVAEGLREVHQAEADDRAVRQQSSSIAFFRADARR